MPLDGMLPGLFDHAAGKIVAAMVLGGLLCGSQSRAHLVSTLRERRQKKQLPVRVIKLGPGSREEEERFLAMVAGG